MPYINGGILKYFRTNEPIKFSMSHAKNVAALASKGSIIVNVDSDNYIGHGFAEHVCEQFSQNEDLYCRCTRGMEGTGGRIATLRKDFLAIGGYEESLQGWGYEDTDFVLRLKLLKKDRHGLPKAFCKSIEHDDLLREANLNIKENESITTQSQQNKAKYDLWLKERRALANVGRIWGRAKLECNFKSVVVTGEMMEDENGPSDTVTVKDSKGLKGKPSTASRFFVSKNGIPRVETVDTL
jgi:hypothetical protein